MPSPVQGGDRYHPGTFYRRKGGAWVAKISKKTGKPLKSTLKSVGTGKGLYSKRNLKSDLARHPKIKGTKKNKYGNNTQRKKYPQEYDGHSHI